MVLNAVNAQRVLHHERPLVTSVALTRVAQDKARDMHDHHYWAHVRKDKSRVYDLEYFLEKEKYPYIEAGENLAINYPFTSALLAAWMASPLHRLNILYEPYKETGIAVGTENGEVTITQIFGDR